MLGHGLGLQGGLIGLDVVSGERCLSTGRAVSEGGAESSDEDDHLEDEVLDDVVGNDRDETNESGGAQSLVVDVEQGDRGAPEGGHAHPDEEGPAQTQVDTEDGGLGDTDDRGDTTSTGQTLHLGVLGQEEDRQGHGPLGDIGHGGDREDEGAGTAAAHLCDERQLHGREGLVQSGHHDRRVDQAEEETTHGSGGRVQPAQAVGNAVGELTCQRAHDDEGEEAGHQQRNQRGQQEVGSSRQALVEPFLDVCQQP